MRYKFDDIAFNSIAKRKPTDDDMKSYIGLEHLDAGDLRVTRFGSKVPISGDKLVIKSGDVLFGRRNTYLRRAAVAPHDGLFSAHGMVLRPKEDVITRGFFPFFISSNYFFDAAIRISVGSISPTVNWGTLKELEFELPSLNEQRSLSEVLWAAIEARNAYKELLNCTEQLVKSQFIEMFGDPVTNPMGWDVKQLESLGSLKNGMNYNNSDSGVSMKCLGVGDFQSKARIESMESLPTISLNHTPSNDYFLCNGDIVFVRSNGNKELVGRSVVVYPNDTLVTFSGFCIRLRLTVSDITVNYISHLLRHPTVKRQMFKDVRGANITNLNQKILSGLQIPLPPLNLQNEFADFVKAADKSKFELQRTLNELEVTYKALLREKLG